MVQFPPSVPPLRMPVSRLFLACGLAVHALACSAMSQDDPTSFDDASAFVTHHLRVANERRQFEQPDAETPFHIALDRFENEVEPLLRQRLSRRDVLAVEYRFSRIAKTLGSDEATDHIDAIAQAFADARTQ